MTRTTCFAGIGGWSRLPVQNRTVDRRGICTIRAGIATSVSESLKEAMKERNAPRVRALRGIRASLLVAMKESGATEGELEEMKAIAQLRKLAKMRRESIEAFNSGGRAEMAQAELEELEVIEEYLPPSATMEQIREWAQEAIIKTKAESKKDFGKVMGVVMKEHREDGVDGNDLKGIVSELLS